MDDARCVCHAARVVTDSWTFLTNHAHVLLCIARDPGVRLRDVAADVGITERAAQRIVAELVEAGYLGRSREGRRNRYEVHEELPLRHPLERQHEIGELLELLGGEGRAAARHSAA
jgi:DNA-binding MarR family transcriptional regulator